MASVNRLQFFSLCLGLLFIFCVSNLHATEWQEVSRDSNLVIYVRHRADSAIEEVRGIGQFNAPISVLKGILADVAKYSDFMPYTKESRVLPGSTQLCYMVLTPPLVGSLDYTIRVHEESVKDSDGGTGYHSSWQLDNNEGPPPRPGVTRVTINEGSWLLEPIQSDQSHLHSLHRRWRHSPPDHELCE